MSYFAAMIAIFFFFLHHYVVSSRERPFKANHYLRYYDVQSSVEQAKYMLLKNNMSSADLSNRLALMLLYSLDVSDHEHGPCLKCALQSYRDHLLPNNPCDIFLFVKPEQFKIIMERPWIHSTPYLYVMLLAEDNDKSFKIPEWIRPDAGAKNRHWTGGGFGLEYRLMGHWRLVFSFPFARDLGYKFIMQADADTFIMEKIGYNLIDHMREKDVWVTNYDLKIPEEREYNMGLPELARYWMISRGRMEGLYVTADNASTAGHGYIKGPVFSHCRPADINGLHTCSELVCRGETWRGWDGEMFSGHYQIFKLDHWFSWEIQDFLQLVIRTGGHIEHRWNEISTQAMIRHMFTPDKHVHIFSDHKIRHGRHPDSCSACLDWMA